MVPSSSSFSRATPGSEPEVRKVTGEAVLGAEQHFFATALLAVELADWKPMGSERGRQLVQIRLA